MFYFYYPVLLIFFFLLYLALSLTDSFIYDTFYRATRLNNGNFLVFGENGNYLFNQTFNLLNNGNIICDYESCNLAHFSEEDGGYIILRSNDYQYILSPDGEKLCQYKSFSDISYYYYSIVPYNHINDIYYYYIIHYYNNYQLYFRKYSFHSKNNSIKEEEFYYLYNIYINGYITCNLMEYNNNKVITCFFSYDNYINSTVFDSENNFTIINTSRTITKVSCCFYYIQSAVITNDGRQKALVCGITHQCYLFCGGYNINTNIFIEKYINEINNNILYFQPHYRLIVSYFRETEEFIVSFLEEYSSNYIYSIFSFDNDFNYSYFGYLGDLTLDNSYCTYKLFQHVEKNFHSIFFSSLTQKYCFVGNIYDINNNYRIAILYINKDIKVKNPHELKPSGPLFNFLCENYSNYSINYSNNSSMIYLEKCTTEYEYIKTYSNCTFYNKTYDFLYNCSEKFPYEIVENNICVEYYNNSNNSSLLSKTSILNYEEENKIQTVITELVISTNITNLIETNYIIDESTEETIEDKLYNILIQDNYMTLPEKIKDIFLSGIINDELDSLSNGGDDITMNVDNYIFQITSTDNQRNNSNHNISTINLGECETILKNEYHIDKNKPLLILKIDTILEGSKIPDIQYKVYHPDKKKPLNLSLCDETKIEINIPVSIDEENIYKYNTSSDYYNNKCNVTDIPLKYRREEFINKNMTLCEADCNYLGYDKETKNSKCKCPIKTEMDLFNLAIDTDLLKNNFVNISNINIDIIKCYYLLFDKDYLIYNIGNYILLFIIFLFAVGSFLFCFKGSYLLNRKINTLLLQTNINRINKTSFNNNNLVTSTSITKNVNKKNKNMKIIKNDKKNKVKNNCYPPIKKDVRKNLRTINKKKNELNEPNSSYQKIELKNNIKLEINRKIQIKSNKKIKQNNKNKCKNLNKKTNNIELKHKSITNNLNYRLKLNDYEMNRLNYKEAMLIDKRT